MTNSPNEKQSKDNPDAEDQDTLNCESRCICDGEPYDGENIRCPAIAALARAIHQSSLAAPETVSPETPEQ